MSPDAGRWQMEETFPEGAIAEQVAVGEAEGSAVVVEAVEGEAVAGEAVAEHAFKKKLRWQWIADYSLRHADRWLRGSPASSAGNSDPRRAYCIGETHRR